MKNWIVLLTMFVATMSVFGVDRPDLVVSLISDPERPEVGDRVNIKYIVANVGTANSPATQISVRLGGSSSISLYDAWGPGPGLHYVGSFSLGVMSAEGQVVVTAIVDPANKIPEANENNNQTQLALQISPRRGPDLQVPYLVLNRSDLYVNEPAWIIFRVRNTGRKPVDRPCRLQCHWGGKIIELPIPGLPPNGEKEYRLPFITTVAQRYLVTVKADVSNELAEYDETNNESTIQFDVKEAGQPDLMIDHVSYEPGSPRVGDWLKILVRVRNFIHFQSGGGAPVDADVCTWYPSAPGGTLHCSSDERLMPGDSHTFELKVQLQKAGNILIPLVVDPHDRYKESVETNNRYDCWVQVRERE